MMIVQRSNIMKSFRIFFGILISLVFSACNEEEAVQPEFPFENEDLRIEWVANYQVTGQAVDAHFIDEKHGVLLTREGYIHITSNGGRDWELVYEPEGFEKVYYDIEFINDQVGFICGGNDTYEYSYIPGGEILRTTNGGLNWEIVYSPASAELTQLAYNGSDKIFSFWRGKLYFSNDMGDTWFENQIFMYNTILDLDFDNGIGYGVGQDGLLIKSNDNGLTWKKLDNSPYPYWITEVEFTGNTGFIKANDIYGPLFRSTDNGSTWEQIDYETRFTNLFYQGDARVVGTGRYTYGNQSACLIYSKDDGNTWKTLIFNSHDDFGDISMYSKNQGYINGYHRLFKITFKE